MAENNFLRDMGTSALAKFIMGMKEVETAGASSPVPNPETGEMEMMMEAMIPTKRNIAQFVQRLGAARNYYAGTEGGQKAAPHIRDLVAYIMTRYPKHAEKVGEYRTTTDVPYGAMEYNLIGKPSVFVNPKTLPKSKDIIDTLMHEVQHATDVDRKGHDFLLKGFIDEPTFNKLPMKNGIWSDYIDYYNSIPSEVRANQAGSTAAKGYDKFRELIKELYR